MPSQENETKPRLSAYFPIIIPAAVILTIIAGWSVFWFFISRQTAAAVTNWMTHEAELGRSWTCPDRKIDGFPFSVKISCANLLFQGKVLDKTVTGTVRGFQATSPLLRNDNMLAKLEPPFVAKTSDGTLDLTMQWDEFYIEFEGKPSAYERIALAGTQVKMQGRVGLMDPVDGGFDEFHSFFSLSPDRHDNAYDFIFSFNDGSIPALSTLLDSQSPIGLQFGGTISQAEVGGAESLPDFLEQWRLANGHVDITTARLTSGGTLLEATGGLDLDDGASCEGQARRLICGVRQGLSPAEHRSRSPHRGPGSLRIVRQGRQ